MKPILGVLEAVQTKEQKFRPKHQQQHEQTQPQKGGSTTNDSKNHYRNVSQTAGLLLRNSEPSELQQKTILVLISNQLLVQHEFLCTKIQTTLFLTALTREMYTNAMPEKETHVQNAQMLHSYKPFALMFLCLRKVYFGILYCVTHNFSVHPKIFFDKKQQTPKFI